MSLSSIRSAAFGGKPNVLLKRLLSHRDGKMPGSWPVELWIYGVGSLVLSLIAGMTGWYLEASGASAKPGASMYLPLAQPLEATEAPASEAADAGGEGWKELAIAKSAPPQADMLLSAGLPLQYQGMNPVIKLDGKDMGGRLPEALWLKLDQPGNAFLVLETDAGVFVKALEDASPGFISRCRMDPHSFGTVDGQPAYLDRSEIKVIAIWLIQDASAQPGRVPGWIAVTPPDDEARPEAESAGGVSTVL